jgi:hypothetical protein
MFPPVKSAMPVVCRDDVTGSSRRAADRVVREAVITMPDWPLPSATRAGLIEADDIPLHDVISCARPKDIDPTHACPEMTFRVSGVIPPIVLPVPFTLTPPKPCSVVRCVQWHRCKEVPLYEVVVPVQVDSCRRC